MSPSQLIKLIAAVACSVAFEHISGARPSMDGPELASVEGLKLTMFPTKEQVNAYYRTHPRPRARQSQMSEVAQHQDTHADELHAAEQAIQMREKQRIAVGFERKQVQKSKGLFDGRGLASHLRRRVIG